MNDNRFPISLTASDGTGIEVLSEATGDGKVLVIGDRNEAIYFDRNELAVFIAALLGIEAVDA